MYELMDDEEHNADILEAQSDTNTQLSLIFFLTASLRPEWWWWPIGVQQVRAMSLAMIVALVPFRSIYLPMGVFAILLGSLLVHIRVQPYKRTVDNNLESLVLVVTLLRYMLSMLAGLDSNTSTKDVTTIGSLLSFLVFMNVLFVLLSDIRKRYFRN